MAVGPKVAAETRRCYRCCDVRKPVLRNCALLIDGRVEEAQDEPEALAQETIIESMSKDEAARLSRVRNIGIAVSVEHERSDGHELTSSGPYRFWQDDSDRASTILHRSN
jgi:hypothetical protein